MDSFQFQAGNGTANGFPNPPVMNVPALFDDQDDDMYGISIGADDGTNEDHNEAKRRRIARVCLSWCIIWLHARLTKLAIGLRYVSEEEDQM